MKSFCLVACVGEKQEEPAPAADLYRSELFLKSRAFAESRFDGWFILSAKHGLVDPRSTIDPYDQTLNDMPVSERRVWSEKVAAQLAASLPEGSALTFLAGARYREFLIPALAPRFAVHIPMEGLSIGHQLRWLKRVAIDQARVAHLDTFYSLLARLRAGLGGERRLQETSGALSWPQKGVYYFFEPEEFRATLATEKRVVRVGTHGVSRGSKSSLWARLSTHRGTSQGTGNHRGSIFRLHVGASLLRRANGENAPASWGKGQSAPAEIRAQEVEWERAVSQFLGQMSLLWLRIEDAAGPTSDRAYLERQSIALLSGPSGPVDRPSAQWLGWDCPNDAIPSSGLWNVNHVRETYDPAFLPILETYIDVTLGHKTHPVEPLAPDGWTTRMEELRSLEPLALAPGNHGNADG